MLQPLVCDGAVIRSLGLLLQLGTENADKLPNRRPYWWIASIPNSPT
jgi:hypothetical protein